MNEPIRARKPKPRLRLVRGVAGVATWLAVCPKTGESAQAFTPVMAFRYLRAKLAVYP